jgi:hypothetical protein
MARPSRPKAAHPLDRLIPLPGSGWETENFRAWVAARAAAIALGAKTPHPEAALFPRIETASKFARRMRREAERWERQAQKNPDRAAECAERSRGCLEAAKRATESSMRLRRCGPWSEEEYDDRRHRPHPVTRELIRLMRIVREAAGRPCFGELAAILSAEGYHVTPVWLRATALRWKEDSGVRTRRRSP